MSFSSELTTESAQEDGRYRRSHLSGISACHRERAALKSWSMSWPHAWLRAATGLWHTTGSGHNVAGAEYDGMANGCNKRFAYHDVDVISVPTFEGKGLCRAHLVLLRHVAGHRASRCGALHAEGLFYASCCVSPTGRACALSSPFMDWTGSVPNRADSLRRT